MKFITILILSISLFTLSACTSTSQESGEKISTVEKSSKACAKDKRKTGSNIRRKTCKSAG